MTLRGPFGRMVVIATMGALCLAIDAGSTHGRSGRTVVSSTHYERFLRERHDSSVYVQHDIGEIGDGTVRAIFAVMHAYEPGRASGHEAEAFALRVDLRTQPATEQVFTGFLDPYEADGLASALPRLLRMADTTSARDHYVQVEFPRGAVCIGLHLSPAIEGGRRLFIQVGRGGPRTFLDLETLPALQALVAASVAKLQGLQRRPGDHH